MEKVTKDTLLSDVLSANQAVVPIFLEAGMHCLGCPSMRYESVGAACAVHGVDADLLIEKINGFIESN